MMDRSIYLSGIASFPGMMSWKRCPDWPDARSVDAHGSDHFSVHDVEAAACIHQYLSEPLCADDQVDHEQISSRLWDAFQVVGLIKGYGGL